MTTTNDNSLTASTTVPVVLPADSEGQRFAATEAQLEVWLSSLQSTEANCAYNEISSLTIRGKLNLAILKRALEKVVERNAALRSTFSADGQEVIVHDAPEYRFELVDWLSLIHISEPTRPY